MTVIECCSKRKNDDMPFILSITIILDFQNYIKKKQTTYNPARHVVNIFLVITASSFSHSFSHAPHDINVLSANGDSLYGEIRICMMFLSSSYESTNILLLCEKENSFQYSPKC